MDKKRIKIIAAAVLALVFIFAGANDIRAINKRKEAPRPVVTQAVVPQTEKTSVIPAPPVKIKESRQDAGAEWGRDPFSGKTYTAASQSQRVTDLKIDGIIWDPKEPLAMINGRVVKKGDNFKGNVIVDIKEDRVILNDGIQDFELKVGK